jgi:hypothetical protein
MKINPAAYQRMYASQWHASPVTDNRLIPKGVGSLLWTLLAVASGHGSQITRGI